MVLSSFYLRRLRRFARLSLWGTQIGFAAVSSHAARRRATTAVESMRPSPTGAARGGG